MMGGPMDNTQVFNQHRPLLFSIAYRMLGSASDADDMVQEAFLRWREAAGVAHPKAYLSTVVTRLCIDHLRSARVKREEYVGVWLPEPLLTTEDSGFTDAASLADSLQVAFLVLLESLSPTERAVFLLREAFDYTYAEVAEIVGRNEAACRQIVKRARDRIAEGRQRFSVSREQKERLTREFVRVCASGDLESLVRLLSEDIILYSDGGGIAGTARKPIYGADRVLRLISALLRKAPPSLDLRVTEVNGQPAVVATAGPWPASVFWLEPVDGLIQTIYIVVNPAKLKSFLPGS